MIAARMVISLARELERGGVRLALAHGIGHVRDMLAEAAVEGTEPLLLYPTVQSAVAACTRTEEGGRALMPPWSG